MAAGELGKKTRKERQETGEGDGKRKRRRISKKGETKGKD
jgi:hypothetical protein